MVWRLAHKSRFSLIQPNLKTSTFLLLTGRSLENSGEAGSSGSVGAALLGLGLAKSGKVVGGIGEAFGIQDLNLGTAGVGDSSKVQVSGNIGKRLQVKYGVGLFDGLAEVTLRYRLIAATLFPIGFQYKPSF